MRSFIPYFIGGCIAALVISCKKDSVSTPEIKPVISNLQYNPTTVLIKPGVASFTITGNLDYTNASGGVANIRLTTSSGIDFTLPVPANSITSGSLTGQFQFGMPDTPSVITFNIWIIDKKGNASNKLPGTVPLQIDDSGNHWQVISQAYPLTKVAWFNKQYIAVGQNGLIATSPDGVTWTLRQSGVSASLFDVEWTGLHYYAAGSNNTILRSPDGINWTRLQEGGDINFMSIASSGNRWVVVGRESGNIPVIYTSNDGAVFNRNSWTLLTGSLNAVTWANNQFVAAGKDYTPFTITSPDGINWGNKQVFPESQGEFMDITWNGSVYAAVGFGIAATSANAITWNAANANMGLTGIVWSGNHFIAVGINGIYRSVNGLDWTQAFDTPYIPRSITWSGSQYVAVGFISPIILASP